MTKKTLAVILSVLVALMPFFGFPDIFKTVFYIVSGLLLVILIELISIHYRELPQMTIEDKINTPVPASEDKTYSFDQEQNEDLTEKELVEDIVIVSTEINKENEKDKSKNINNNVT